MLRRLSHRRTPPWRHRIWRAVACAVVVGTAALASAATAGAQITTTSSGTSVGIQPISGAAPTSSSEQSDLFGSLEQSSDTSSNLTYHGGPVVHGLKTYALLWDPGGQFSSGTEAQVAQYLAAVAHDSGSTTNVFSVATQYTDTTGGAQYSQTFGGAYVDTAPYPTSGNCSASTAAAPICVYDSQEVAALQSFVAANNLPSGLGAEYFVLTPSDVVTCLDGTSQCSTNAYCSFHSYAGSGSTTLLYAEIPFTLLASASEAKSCQDDGNAAVESPNGAPGLTDVALKSMSHEEMETITDPLLNAWFTSSGDEIADGCNGVFWNADSFLPVQGGNASAGTLFNQTIDGSHYYLQGAWSNQAGGCELMSALEPHFSVTVSPANAGQLTFTAVSGTQAPIADANYLWTFGDGQTASGASVAHNFATNGQYDVSLTVTDSYGNTGSVSTLVAVSGQSLAAVVGKATSAHKRSTSTTCGPVHAASGRQTRVCTTTSISFTVRSRCTRPAVVHGVSRARVCHRVRVRVTRRQSCRVVRSGRTKLSSRCSAVRVRASVIHA